jgi:hypothetical protein
MLRGSEVNCEQLAIVRRISAFLHSDLVSNMHGIKGGWSGRDKNTSLWLKSSQAEDGSFWAWTSECMFFLAPRFSELRSELGQ